jgi:transcriptional regulator with XRE-family HTH domain
MENQSQILFGKKVRAAREAAGISRDDAAEKAGITVNYLGEIERGEKWPSLDIIRAIARAVKASPAVFLELEDEESDSGAIVEKLVRIFENRTAEQRQKAFRILKAFFEP